MIIGITGTFAAGKDTVADYLKEKGFEHFSLGEELTDIANERGLAVSRDNLRELGNEMRDQNGPEYLAKRVMGKVSKENVAIAGIRQPAEIDFLKQQKSFYLVSVDAPIEIRFERMSSRSREGDPKTLEELKEKEQKEMSGSKNAQQILACMERADFTIINDGDFQKLHKEVDNVIVRIEGISH